MQLLIFLKKLAIYGIRFFSFTVILWKVLAISHSLVLWLLGLRDMIGLLLHKKLSFLCAIIGTLRDVKRCMNTTLAFTNVQLKHSLFVWYIFSSSSSWNYKYENHKENQIRTNNYENQFVELASPSAADIGNCETPNTFINGMRAWAEGSKKLSKPFSERKWKAF